MFYLKSKKNKYRDAYVNEYCDALYIYIYIKMKPHVSDSILWILKVHEKLPYKCLKKSHYSLIRNIITAQWSIR